MVGAGSPVAVAQAGQERPISCGDGGCKIRVVVRVRGRRRDPERERGGAASQKAGLTNNLAAPAASARTHAPASGCAAASASTSVAAAGVRAPCPARPPSIIGSGRLPLPFSLPSLPMRDCRWVVHLCVRVMMVLWANTSSCIPKRLRSVAVALQGTFALYSIAGGQALLLRTDGVRRPVSCLPHVALSAKQGS